MTDTSRWAVEHPLGLIIRLTEDPDTGAWDDPTSSYARGVEAAALIRALMNERDRALAREAAAYEAVAREREACARLVNDFAAAIRRGADVCRESHPSFAADRDEYADDAEQVAAAIRNRGKGDA